MPFGFLLEGAVTTDSYNGSQDGIGVTQSTQPQCGQTFDPSITGTIHKIRLFISKAGSPTGNCRVYIYAHTGTFGSSGVPTGAILATSQDINVAALPASPTAYDFVLQAPLDVVNGTKYCWALEFTGGDVSNYVALWSDTTSFTAPGNAFVKSGGSYFVDTLEDFNYFLTIAATTADRILLEDTSLLLMEDQPTSSTKRFSLLGVG